MHRILLLLCFCALASLCPAQQKISFFELEEMYRNNNPLLQAKKAELKAFDGRLIEARRLPNPELNAGVESLSKGSTETETSVSLAQELDLNNTRRWHVFTLEHLQKAETHRLSHEMRAGLTELKKSFCRSLMLERDVSALNEVLGTVKDVETRSQTRFADGDVSEVDVMRLTAEKQKVVLLIDGLKNDAHNELITVAARLGIATAEVQLDAAMPLLPAAFDSESLYQLALANREDLKAAREKLRAGETSIVAAKREVRSPLTLEGGYKARNGGFNGFIVGVSAPLPFNNRNRGKIQELTAENEAGKLHVVATEKELAASLKAAVEEYAFLTSREKLLAQQIEEHKKIAGIARFNFEEGETGLLEILDAVRGQSDLILELNRTIMESWFVVFELENLTGADLIKTGENG